MALASLWKPRFAKFKKWVNNIPLLEVEFSGACHTWVRGLTTQTRKSARLDRALCKSDYELRFENAKVKYLRIVKSNYFLIFISRNRFAPSRAINRLFRY